MSDFFVCNQLRVQGLFTDAVIKIENVEFQIHKIILCNCSPYFRALFTSWSQSEKNYFEIPGLSPHIMQLIIDYAYTGITSVTEGVVQDLLLAADQLIVDDMILACWDFLERHLCAENCIGIWKFTHICLCPKLQRRAYQCVIDNFEKVALGDEILHVSLEELTGIIMRDELAVGDEAVVFTAIHHWVAHSPKERKTYFPFLFSKVRLALMRPDFINFTVKTNELVRNNCECLQMVDEALHIRHQMRREIPPVCAVRNPVARPRLPTAILLAIGGWSARNACSRIEAYDFYTDIWINVDQNLEPRAYHGTAVINGCLYCLGGFDRVEYFNSVCKFDLSTRTWHNVAPMYFRRCYVSVALLDGYIYAMGGFNGHVRVNTAERYRPETNQWTLIAPMMEQRSDASSTAFDNKIYICGGFNGIQCLETCEFYEPETDQWTAITQMNSLRSGFGLTAYAGKIYAVGGFDGSSRLRSAEAYSPETDSWSPIAPMFSPRSNFGIEVFEDRLFVAGGFNGNSITNKVEYYNADTHQWYEARDMGIFRSALSCSVVQRHPSMSEYTVPRDTLPFI